MDVKHDPPYYSDDIECLDQAHRENGMYEWWKTSKARELVLATPNPARICEGITHDWDKGVNPKKSNYWHCRRCGKKRRRR